MSIFVGKQRNKTLKKNNQYKKKIYIIYLLAIHKIYFRINEFPEKEKI